ncbi:hypothetical protein [Streptomyces flavofungini]|uniref:hypothetical protein n=1 Tax=Streptomyces flavofungini TaxID=68200 RepID=UPI0034E00E21
MSASERDAEPRPHAHPRPHGLPVPSGAGPLSMSALLASCAAASAVSTPPEDPTAAGDGTTERR